ncbi:hypothetical protein ACFOLF_16405 [Paenibacillus sepulcri]|uniref:Permease n=1 Tax=Paenibacillus sepulcri TaxID=359917 RepID=A0ABS7BX48_9BACL|nr:hypothetical protein [Paenibacillus sepulcri]
MMYFKKLLDEWLTWKWSFLFILMFIFGWSKRQNVIDSSIFIQSRLNQWDILIGISGDPFMLLYLILPVLLLLSCVSIRETFDITYLVRVQSWSKWVMYSVKLFSPIVVVITTILLITSVLLTAGLPYETTWSAFSSADLSTFNYMSSFSMQSNLSPYVVLFLQLCLLIIFMLVVHAFIAALYLYFSNLIYLGIISFTILLYALVSFRYFPELPQLIAFNYMTFPSSYGTFREIYPAFMILVGILIICIFLVPLLKKWRLPTIKMWIKAHYPYLGYALLCLLGITSPYLNPGVKPVTVWDTLYLRFSGVSPEGGVSLLSFLFYVIVFMGFVYLFQVYITEYLSGRFYYVAIRYRSLPRWLARLGGRIGLGAVALLVVLVVLTVIVGLISGQTLEPKVTILPDLNFSQVLYQFLFNGWLQIISGIMIVFITAWLFKDASYSLITLGVLVLAALPMINVGGWLPAGLNSMGYVSGQWEDLLRITGVLVIYLLIEFGVILYLFRKKNIAFY